MTHRIIRLSPLFHNCTKQYTFLPSSSRSIPSGTLTLNYPYRYHLSYLLLQSTVIVIDLPTPTAKAGILLPLFVISGVISLLQQQEIDAVSLLQMYYNRDGFQFQYSPILKLGESDAYLTRNLQLSRPVLGIGSAEAMNFPLPLRPLLFLLRILSLNQQKTELTLPSNGLNIR